MMEGLNLEISTQGNWADGASTMAITVHDEKGLPNGSVELANVSLAMVDNIRTNITVTKFESTYMVDSKAAGYVSMKTPHNVGSVQEAAEEVARLSIFAVTGRWLPHAAQTN